MAKKNVSDALRQDKSVKPAEGAEGVPTGALKLADVGKSKVRATLGRTPEVATIELCLFNDGKRNAVVELTGAVLHPDDGSYQRLFVAGRHDAAVPVIKIPAGKEVKIPLATCCMDKNLHGPAVGVEYRITAEVAPEKNVTAARNWIAACNAVKRESRAQAIVTNRYAIQNEYKGDLEKPIAPEEVTADTRRKAQLSYVQDVCWGAEA